MASRIEVTFSPQIADGYCLPACAQMVLAYIGIERTQEQLAHIMGLVENLGIPASRILRLQSNRSRVEYYAEGNLQDLRSWLNRLVPVIACVQTGHFSYW